MKWQGQESPQRRKGWERRVRKNSEKGKERRKEEKIEKEKERASKKEWKRAREKEPFSLDFFDNYRENLPHNAQSKFAWDRVKVAAIKSTCDPFSKSLLSQGCRVPQRISSDSHLLRQRTAEAWIRTSMNIRVLFRETQKILLFSHSYTYLIEKAILCKKVSYLTCTDARKGILEI